MKITFPVSENQLVLTVNNRLKRHLELLDADAREQSGQTIWPSSSISPINNWLQETYLASWPDKWILSPLQSQFVWESILESDSDFKILDALTLKGAAKDAARAYSLLHQYEIPVSEKGFSGTEETRSFFRWEKAYEGDLKRLGAIDSAQVISCVRKKIAAKEITLPQKIFLAGFDEITPSLKSLIQTFKNSGSEVGYFPEYAESSNYTHLEASSHIEVRRHDDVKSEAIQCARWIRSQYKQGLRIGVVATRLEEIKTLLERELKAELAPASIFPWEQSKLPFNVSLGQPLIKEPLFAPALMLLSCADTPLPYQRYLQVIKSPYLIPEMDDENVVGDLETRLVKRKTQEISLEALRSLTKPAAGKTQKTSRQYKSIRSLLAKWIEFIKHKKYQSRKLPSEWARIFSKFLAGIGWPATHRKLNSREIQAYLEWESRLDQMTTLDPIVGRVSRIYAAECLKDMVVDPAHPFQEQTTEDSPIQVMGLLESAGQTFDSLWVMGCDADVLPEPLRPTPFIPIRLQKKLELPYASPERQFRFSKALLTRLGNSSRNTVFSYSLLKDKEPKRISPLLAHLRESGESIETSSKIKDQIVSESLPLFDDNRALPVSDSALSKVQGGYTILKNQAECPFRAFAIHRLLADRYQTAETDFEHIERGNIIHSVMELVWKNLKTRERLEQLTKSKTLEPVVGEIINDILAKDDYKRLKTQPEFRKLEMERLNQLVLDWLRHELQRPDFKVVEVEKKDKFDFEGMTIRFRADRIDELTDGQKIIIDYKSGQISPKSWFKEPVLDPQLPLYALHLKPQGIALAKIKKGEFQIATAADSSVHNNVLKKPGEMGSITWDELCELWNKQLKTLASNFKNGEIQISPVQDEVTCRNCQHSSFCRVEELKQRLDSTN